MSLLDLDDAIHRAVHARQVIVCRRLILPSQTMGKSISVAADVDEAPVRMKLVDLEALKDF